VAELRKGIRPYAVASDRETASIHRRLVEKLTLRMSQPVRPPLRVLEHQPALPPPLNIPQLFINQTMSQPTSPMQPVAEPAIEPGFSPKTEPNAEPLMDLPDPDSPSPSPSPRPGE